MIYKLNIQGESIEVSDSNDSIIKIATKAVLHKYDQERHPSLEDVKQEILDYEATIVIALNTLYTKKEKIPKKLYPSQIADILLTFFHIINIITSEYGNTESNKKLAIYDEKNGVYSFSSICIKDMILDLNYLISTKELSEVMSFLSQKAPIKKRTMNPDLIAVNNGIFDYSKKKLLAFSPDYVFVSKCHTDYNPLAENIVIHNDTDGTDWDLESWLFSLSDDAEIVNLLWEVISAIIRPFVSWNKSIWLYSDRGNNGKGTFCSLLRNICGKETTISIPLSQFSDRFALAGIIDKSAIITDENDVGTFIDKAAVLKALITHDAVNVEKKHIDVITFQFYGLIVQCLNEPPRIKDKSNSFFRRQIFIPFDKCFTGIERKYIKDDYLQRDEVLQYALYRALHTDFYEFCEPAACKDALRNYKELNDPVREFLSEMLPQLVWDFLPFSFLYDLYRAWFMQTNPSGKVQGRTTFISDVLNIISDYPEWTCAGRDVAVRPGKMMNTAEPLIAEYNLSNWMNENYCGRDIDKLCHPTQLKQHYSGLRRISISD